MLVLSGDNFECLLCVGYCVLKNNCIVYMLPRIFQFSNEQKYHTSDYLFFQPEKSLSALPTGASRPEIRKVRNLIDSYQINNLCRCRKTVLMKQSLIRYLHGKILRHPHHYRAQYLSYYHTLNTLSPLLLPRQ